MAISRLSAIAFQMGPRNLKDIKYSSGTSYFDAPGPWRFEVEINCLNPVTWVSTIDELQKLPLRAV